MVDTDVEKTLRALRERVRVQIRSQSPAALEQSKEPGPNPSNGSALESLKANLAVIERSWNRLPPLTSYRTGWRSRLELWLKRLLKRATHWFTWEQVNFNAATSNSMRDILAVVSLHEEILRELQKDLQRISSKVDEVRLEVESLAANGYVTSKSINSDHPPSSEPAILEEARHPVANQQQIDSDIKSLAARIEELRTIKARLNS